MRPISRPLLDRILSEKEYKVCARQRLLKDHVCKGRITLEHALTYAGRQIDAHFAIIPLCAYAHSVDEWQDKGILNKEINEWIALNRATDEDRLNYPRINWHQRLRYLNGKYGFPIVVH